MNIIIPMAGKGQRFIDAGYTEDKPFVDVLGKPMVQVALENMPIKGHYHFLTRPEHATQMIDLVAKIKHISNFTVHSITSSFKGSTAACLSLKNKIENDDPLIIANCDQLIDWDANVFLRYCQQQQCVGCIPTFKSSFVQHSYARETYDGRVVEIKEKRVISNNALCGIHYWFHTGLAMWSFKQSLQGPPHFNNDYYIAPTYNELIKRGCIILQYRTEGMVVLGTPHQLENYINEQR